MAKCFDSSFGVAVCEALGLDPDWTGNIRISVKTDRHPVVLVEHILADAERERVVIAIARYELTAKAVPTNAE